MWPHRNMFPCTKPGGGADQLIDTLLYTFQHAPEKDKSSVELALFQVVREEYGDAGAIDDQDFAKHGRMQGAPGAPATQFLPVEMSMTKLLESSEKSCGTTASSRLFKDQTICSTLKRSPDGARRAKEASWSSLGSLQRSLNETFPWESSRSRESADGRTESVKVREYLVASAWAKGQYSTKGVACKDHSRGLSETFATPKPQPWRVLKKRPPQDDLD